MRYPLPSLLLLVLFSSHPIVTLAQDTASDPVDRSQARSMVISRQGIVATEQTLASQAGAQVLARGGSAADAAIAANAVLGVMAPMMDSIGGDLFAIEWDARTGKLAGLNASGWAPEKLTPELVKQKGFTRMPGSGIYSVTVPGCVRGWEHCTRSSDGWIGQSYSNPPFTTQGAGFQLPR
jgi:gamma-glutamyltranspeptidase/glutathione hydrolase